MKVFLKIDGDMFCGRYHYHLDPPREEEVKKASLSMVMPGANRH